jgi:hypothetical protein
MDASRCMPGEVIWQVFGGDGVGWGFGVPIDVDDPVAFAVLEELEAVDAAGEGSGVVGVVAGFVGAPDLDDVAELLDLIVDGMFEEAGRGHSDTAAGDVTVDGEEDGVSVGGGAAWGGGHGGGGDEAGVGEEERTHAVPVAGLALGAGYNAVDGGENGLGRADVFGLCGRPSGVAGDGAYQRCGGGRRVGIGGLCERGGAGQGEDEQNGGAVGLLHEDSFRDRDTVLPRRRFCELPGDIYALLDPLRIADLLHHGIGHVLAGDAAAVGREGIAVDAIRPMGGGVGEHWRHDHGPVEIAVGEILQLRDLRGYRPFEEGVVDDVLHDPATPGRLLVERGGQRSGRAEDDDAADRLWLRCSLLHRGNDLWDGTLEDVLLLERICAKCGEDGVGSFDRLADGCEVEWAALEDANAVAQGELFRCTQERSDLVAGSETAPGEQGSGGSACTEDGDVHGSSLVMRERSSAVWAGLVILVDGMRV